MAVTGEIIIDKATFAEADKLLAKIEREVRGPAVTAALRSVGRGVIQKTRAVLPKAGYHRFTRPKHLPYDDKEEPKPLEKTMVVKIVNYADGAIKVAIIGYAWPAGAHGHLVEQGHDLVKGGSKKSGGVVIGHVEPAEYMIRVVEETRSQQNSDLLSGIRKALNKR